jgi:hypothetical protein
MNLLIKLRSFTHKKGTDQLKPIATSYYTTCGTIINIFQTQSKEKDDSKDIDLVMESVLKNYI